MNRVCTPVAAHRRRLSKGVIDSILAVTVHRYLQEVNLQLQGNGVNLIIAKSAAIFTLS